MASLTTSLFVPPAQINRIYDAKEDIAKVQALHRYGKWDNMAMSVKAAAILNN